MAAKDPNAKSIWETKGKDDPADLPPKPMENAAVKKVDEAAKQAMQQAEEMKKMTEMALASLGDAKTASADALKSSAEKLEEVQSLQDNIKETDNDK